MDIYEDLTNSVRPNTMFIPELQLIIAVRSGCIIKSNDILDVLDTAYVEDSSLPHVSKPSVLGKIKKSETS
jgi:hypothetical protein